MTMSTANLIGGPCRAYIDVSSTPTEMGHLNGGVNVNIVEPSIMDLMADGFGDTPADGVFQGRSGRDTAIIRLAEYTLENLARAIPNSVLSAGTEVLTEKRLEIRAVAGTTLSSIAKEFVFKPIDPSTGIPSTDENTWVYIPKGVAIGAVTLPYKKGEQRTIEMTIACLPDSSNNNRTIWIGKKTFTPDAP